MNRVIGPGHNHSVLLNPCFKLGMHIISKIAQSILESGGRTFASAINIGDEIHATKHPGLPERVICTIQFDCKEVGNIR